jgi:protein TonB
VEPRPTETEVPETSNTSTTEAEAAADTPEPDAGADQATQQEQVELVAGGDQAVDQYLGKLARHLSRYREYPRRARRLGQEGTPVVIFEFDRNGKLLEARLRDSSSHRLLDEAALELLRDASPLPEVPESMTGRSFTYTLPVGYKLR